MLKKKTTEQELIDLFDELLRDSLKNAYVLHCTVSERVVEAANKAMNKEYKERMQEFKDKLDELDNRNFRCTVHGRVSAKIIRNPHENDWSSWQAICPQCSREVSRP